MKNKNKLFPTTDWKIIFTTLEDKTASKDAPFSSKYLQNLSVSQKNFYK